MAHDVFISYSSKDKAIADAVCAKLEEQRIRAWIAPRDVPPGANFAQSIIQAINSCKVFILIWSANTNTSEHILNEINQAFDRGITIIPFRIQDIQPTDEMRYYFGRTHWLDAIDPPLESHIATLRDTVQINLDREAQLGKEPGFRDPLKDSRAERMEETASAEKSPSKAAKKETSATGFPPVKMGGMIPIAVGGLAIIAVAAMFVSGVFKGPASSEARRSPVAQIADILPTRTLRPTATPKPTATAKPTPTVTPIPAWVEEVSGPILTGLDNQAPDLVEDFSEVDPSWTYSLHSTVHTDEKCTNTTGVGMSITSGSLKGSIDSYCPQIILWNDRMTPFTNSALQMDIDLENTNGTASIEYFYPSEYAVSVALHSNGDFNFGVNKGGNDIEMVNWEEAVDWSKPHTITMIYKSPYYLVYVDGVLLFSKDDLEIPYSLGGWNLNMWNESSQPFETETFEFDNLKIWDLDKFES
jgi:hypothetical protein